MNHFFVAEVSEISKFFSLSHKSFQKCFKKQAALIIVLSYFVVNETARKFPT